MLKNYLKKTRQHASACTFFFTHSDVSGKSSAPCKIKYDETFLESIDFSVGKIKTCHDQRQELETHWGGSWKLKTAKQWCRLDSFFGYRQKKAFAVKHASQCWGFWHSLSWYPFRKRWIYCSTETWPQRNLSWKTLQWIPCPLQQPMSCNQVMHHMTVHIGQAKITPLIAISQSSVINTK